MSHPTAHATAESATEKPNVGIANASAPLPDREVTMPTTRHRDTDEEFAAWLQALKDSRLPAAQLNELYQAREEARAVKDTDSPAFAEAHERIDRALAGLGY